MFAYSQRFVGLLVIVKKVFKQSVKLGDLVSIKDNDEEMKLNVQ